jgi:hypothetical protein
MTTTINASTSSGLVNTADTSGILQLQTASTAALTIDGSQNVGIGTSTPQTRLNLWSSSARGEVISNAYPTLMFDNTSTPAQFYITQPTADVYFSNQSSSGALIYNTNNTERMRIYSNGLVKVVTTGTTAPTYSFTNYGEGLMFSNGDNSGSRYSDIVSLANTPAGATSNMRFWTNEGGGAGTATEKMRIDSSGNLLVGTTATIGSAKMVVEGSVADDLVRIRNTNAAPYGILINYTTVSPNNTTNGFLENYDSTGQRATIRSNGGLANYSANNVNLSDRREKNNFAPAKSYLDVICAIPVQTFNYIDQNIEEDAGLTLGVVAQDVQAVAPEMVMESNWASKDEPEKMRLSIYQTDLQYALMKSIQELKAINDTQAETINALTARIVALEK